MKESSLIGRGATVVVTGAGGQDGRFIVPRLLDSGATVHAIVRDEASLGWLGPVDSLSVHGRDLDKWDDIGSFLAELQPSYFFNLAGQSSVRESFDDPQKSWRVNASWVASLLEAVRRFSPDTRIYQASSSEMFGWSEGASVVHDEESPLKPRSPYAASKAAAHMLCSAYRAAFGVRVACGILFNHESRFRGPGYLTSKIAGHVRSLRVQGASSMPLTVGDFEIRRDWGYAGEFAEGVLRVIAQTALRNEPDVASNYRDYVLGTGTLTSVKDLIDRAFTMGGFELDWRTESRDRTLWHACFKGSDEVAVRADPAFFRVSEPAAIQADPSRAATELGWRATPGVDLFLKDMILRSDGYPGNL